MASIPSAIVSNCEVAIATLSVGWLHACAVCRAALGVVQLAASTPTILRLKY